VQFIRRHCKAKKVFYISIYERLLSLYSKSGGGNKTPLEDFTTELLVGTLEKDKEVLDKYVNDVLKVDGAGFSIKSQGRYYLDDDINCIVDIVIENDEHVCFVENKVNSCEGERQLERYTKVLNNINKEQGKEIHLRYCTKYYDLKENNFNIDFEQFRWCDIYKYLEQFGEENKLIEEFLIFLRGEDMASAGTFNYEDLMTMKTIYSTIAKMNECLDNIKPKLTETFGKPYERDFERLKEIPCYNAYNMWSENIMGEEGFSTVIVGFFFDDGEESIGLPFAQVNLKVSSNNNKYEAIKNKENEAKEIFDTNYSTSNIFEYSFRKPLSDFISSEKQTEEICEWFEDKINKVKDFISNI